MGRDSFSPLVLQMSRVGNDQRSYNRSRLMTESCGTRPASSLWRGTDFGRAGEITQTPTAQTMANASTLEQRKTKLAAVSTRKPAVANAPLRMGLPNERLFGIRQKCFAGVKIFVRSAGRATIRGSSARAPPYILQISPYGRSEEEAAAPSPYPRNTPLR